MKLKRSWFIIDFCISFPTHRNKGIIRWLVSTYYVHAIFIQTNDSNCLFVIQTTKLHTNKSFSLSLSLPHSQNTQNKIPGWLYRYLSQRRSHMLEAHLHRFKSQTFSNCLRDISETYLVDNFWIIKSTRILLLHILYK